MLVSNLIAIIFILEILDYNVRAINQLIQDQFEINDKIADTDKKLKIEELKQLNRPFEIQSYMDYLLKENKDKYEIYIEQIEDYKELYHIDIKLMKGNVQVIFIFFRCLSNSILTIERE